MAITEINDLLSTFVFGQGEDKQRVNKALNFFDNTFVNKKENKLRIKSERWILKISHCADLPHHYDYE